jgi:hypothetical protein
MPAMTRDQFRKLALSFPEAAESAHMDHPDFRVRGKIFATLGYPDGRHGMVKLTPNQQADCVESDSASAFSPAAGAWGRRGATTVLLKAADRELVRIALAAAWRSVAPKTLVRDADARKTRSRE